ncbi:MAG: mandelate racemase/muconate lactonizing enzyme family protein [Bryobacteraceae bacterium]|nr:mandelate racemase/muconate lactonizing enzyme family protein [Bryobacteraceae bacterium]
MDRRSWLTGAASGLLLPWTSAAQAPRPVVGGLETFRVRVNRRGEWVLFRLTASSGLTGIGDASHGGDDELAMSLGRGFAEAMKGRGIFDVEWLRRTALPEVERSKRPAAVALGGIEQCLWDLQGKALGLPVYKLFGGMLHPRIRNYANINRSTEERSPAGFAAMARQAVSAGFDAVKLAPFDDMPRLDADPKLLSEFTELGVERTRAVREAIGPEKDLLIDVHSRMDLPRGLELAQRLATLNLYWLEEVCRGLPELAAINKAAPMPTAGGESLFGTKGFYEYIKAGAVDIVMPDIKYCGGLLEMKKIAAMAEGAGLPASPHGPASPVGNMAAAHVCATLPNFQILEYAFGEVPWRADLVEPPETLDRGWLGVPERPGFGIALNEETIRRHAV